MRAPRNYFKVNVRFKDHAYGVESLKGDITMTPEQVAIELEAIAARIRKTLAAEAPAGDPHGE